MTEREPDPLYDALRDRLADYGQEPPAPLWATIRAQLPPPVAVPVLRPRRRWRRALLSLLLLLVAIGGWRWWPVAGRYAGRDEARPAPASKPASAGGAGSAERGVGAPASSATTGPAVATQPSRAAQTGLFAEVSTPTNKQLAEDYSGPQGGNTPANGTRPVALVMRKQSDAAQAGAIAASPMATMPGSRTRGQSPRALSEKGALATATASRTTGGSTSTRGTSSQAAAPLKPGLTTTSGQAARLVAAAHDTGLAQGSSPDKPATPPTAYSGAPTVKASPAATVAGAAVAVSAAAVPAAASAALTVPATSGAAADTKSRAVSVVRNPPEAGSAAGSRRSHSLAVARSRARPAGGRAQGGAAVAMGPAEAWRPLAGRPAVLLPTSSLTRPGALAGVDTLPRLPALAPARWAIQVLGGPSLSYRYLGSASQLNAPAPPRVNYSLAANPDVATLERPALSGGGELSIRRQLPGPWSISAGLGYVEYATRLAVQLVKPAAASSFVPFSDSTIASFHRRDTYRFVTIPVRLGYSRAVSNRWRVGVLAGADAAIYVGGRTTEGSACACQTQTWGPDNSPYRRLSLGLSLGVEARYRLNGRWELLAQPAASYLLSPLNKLSTTDYERHLFGATALLGAAWDLP